MSTGSILVSDLIESRHAAALDAAAPGVPRTVLGAGGNLDGEAGDVEIAYFSGDLFPARASEFWRPVLGMTRLRWLHSYSAGVDHWVFQKLLAQCVRLTNSSGASSVPIAHTVMLYILALSRDLRRFLEAQARHAWEPRDVEDLSGRVLGVVGLGPIGLEVARLGQAFGMRVIGLRRAARGDEPCETWPLSRLDELLPLADYLVLALPLTAETRHLIDARALSLLRPTARVINVGRGELIEEASLTSAIAEGRLAGAGLDVFEVEPLPPESPLWDLRNAVVTPHSAGNNPGNDERATAIFVDNLARFVKGEPLVNEVPRFQVPSSKFQVRNPTRLSDLELGTWHLEPARLTLRGDADKHFDLSWAAGRSVARLMNVSRSRAPRTPGAFAEALERAAVRSASGASSFRGNTTRRAIRLSSVLILAFAGCGGSGSSTNSGSSPATLEQQVRQEAQKQGLKGNPTLDQPNLTPQQQEIVALRVELGRNLFFDHAMSGVEHTSCGTCHHAAFQFSDARNIARGTFCDLNAHATQIFCRDAPTPGEDGNVVGPERTSPLNSRNSPLLINNALFPKLMWNGRFRFIDQSSTDVNKCDASLGFQFPAPEKRLDVRSLLTAQAHIPVTEAVEMTGDFPHIGRPFEEAEERNPEIRAGIANRISNLPAYRSLFEEAYAPGTRIFLDDPEVDPGADIPYLPIADAVGHFIETLIFTDAPWDHFLKGDDGAISDAAKRGALTFLTTGKCSACHAGDLFSDFDNYNIGVPQVGPGTAQSDLNDPTYEGLITWDFGLEEINANSNDRFKFRTPPLRGVALSSPYMHNGAFTKLEDAIRHHTDPEASYASYDITQIELDMQLAEGLKPMGPVFDRRNPVVLGHDAGQTRIDLSGDLIDDLVAFLESLTDPRMLDTASLAPATVPSGLPVDVVGPRQFPLYQ